MKTEAEAEAKAKAEKQGIHIRHVYREMVKLLNFYIVGMILWLRKKLSGFANCLFPIANLFKEGKG